MLREYDRREEKKRKQKSFRTGCLLIGGILLLVLVISVVPGFYMRHFADPEAYFEYVAKREVKHSVDLCVDFYEEILNYLNVQDSGGAVEIGARIDENVLELLSFVSSTDWMWLANPNLSFTYSLYGERFLLEMGAFLGEDALMEMNAVYDIADEQAYMQVPELSDVWVTERVDTDVEALYELQAIYERYPDAESFREMLQDYAMELIGCAEDVEKGKGTLMVDGISQKCMTLTTRIESALLGENGKVTLVLYVDGRHRVVGADVCSQEWSLHYALPRKGTRCGVELTIDTGATQYCLVGSGKLSGTEMSGEFDLSYNNANCFRLKVDELSWMKLLGGSLYGRFEVMALEGADELLEAVSGRNLPMGVSGYGIQLTVEKEKNRTRIESSLLGDEEQLLEVYVSYLAGEEKPVELPAAESCISMQEEQALEKWMGTMNWDSYFERLRSTQIPTWFVDYLEKDIVTQF